MSLLDSVFSSAQRTNELPRWPVGIPKEPTTSLDGHFELPYLFEAGGTVWPSKWPWSAWLWRIFAVLFLLPAFFLLTVALGLLKLRQPAIAPDWELKLQNLSFKLVTLFEEEGYSGARQVGVMFPGENTPWPVDVQMVAPVVMLYGIGAPTMECCDGHGGVPYIQMAWPHEVPHEVLLSLNAAGVQYSVSPPDAEGGALLCARPGSEDEFMTALQAWALEKAPKVLAP